MTLFHFFVTIRNILIKVFEIYGGALASTCYEDVREHTELCLDARKKNGQTISANNQAQEAFA